MNNWYIAIIANNTEKETALKLCNDYEVFVPSQKYVSIWKDGRRKIRERILIPGKILIHCTEKERLELVNLSFIKRFMVDIAGTPNQFGRRPIAVIPDDQIERFKFVLGQSDVKVAIDNVNLKAGEMVRVIRGSLSGLEGIVTDWSSKATRIHINIDFIGNACMEINLDDVERIRD